MRSASSCPSSDRRMCACFRLSRKEAYRCRWDVSVFILASLTEAFKDRMEEDEVESIAAEAAQKVRERTAVAVPEPPPMPAAPPAKPQPVSMERALNDAEAQIAALDAVAAKTMGKRVVRKGVPQCRSKRRCDEWKEDHSDSNS